jgi:undecaprenyl-diphosphatase
MPLYAVGSILMTIDAPFVCCWGLAWLCLSHVRTRNGEAAWFGAGAAFGVGLLSKYTMFMLIPCVVLWLISSPRLRHWFRRRAPYEAVLLGLVIFSPVVVWNARHGWYSMRHVLMQAGAGSDRPLLARLAGGPEFLASQLGVVSPLLFILLCLALRWAWREGVRRERDDLLLLVCAAVPVFVFFQAWSFLSKVQGNWAAHAFLTATVAVAGWHESWFAPGVSRRSRSRLSRWLIASIMVPALALPIVFAPDALDWAGIRLPVAWDLVSKRLRGWPELGQAVGEVIAAAPRPPFLASDRYQIASQLAFYVPGHPTVYNANFGRRRNQYDLWGGWEELADRDGVFVLSGVMDPPPALRDAFRAVERVRTLVVSRHGQPIHTYSIFRGHEFRGFHSQPFAGY